MRYWHVLTLILIVVRLRLLKARCIQFVIISLAHVQESGPCVHLITFRCQKLAVSRTLELGWPCPFPALPPPARNCTSAAELSFGSPSGSHSRDTQGATSANALGIEPGGSMVGRRRLRQVLHLSPQGMLRVWSHHRFTGGDFRV